MGNNSRLRSCKFFRRLIASRQPQEIEKIVDRYEKDRKATEGGLIDIVIRTEGAISYQDILTMPVDSIELLVERMNARVEEINNNTKSSRR